MDCERKRGRDIHVVDIVLQQCLDRAVLQSGQQFSKQLWNLGGEGSLGLAAVSVEA